MASLVVASCGEDSATPTRDEGGYQQPCYPNDTCNAGFQCENHRCELDDPLGSGASSGAPGVAGSGATPDSNAAAGVGGHDGGAPGTAGVTPNGGSGAPSEGGGGQASEPTSYRPMPNGALSGLPNAAAYDLSKPGIVIDTLTQLMWSKAVLPNYFLVADVDGACEAYDLGGYTDWRLPSRIELISLIDFSSPESGKINPNVFDPQHLNDIFWTSTRRADQPSSAGRWVIYFSDGSTVFETTAAWVRCVRGEPFAPSYETGVGTLAGTVKDLTTGLLWQQTADTAAVSFATASSSCGSSTLAGFDDWRIPSITELHLLVDDTLRFPAIDVQLFPGGTQGNLAFFSAPEPSVAGYAWKVNFETGEGRSYGIAPEVNVRCVR